MTLISTSSNSSDCAKGAAEKKIVERVAAEISSDLRYLEIIDAVS